ncbi:large conductance mechanosensitive channel protein MscL [Gracilibacillus salitolerans]|uniref:Large-conductance mechanosensitive channel n=1 Tax=Gracilibacillus salitolerans TaxID=2663022 RepID=A0A5Q2TTU1_9BACI|nr:large conductance mechanosensitive channel protein MscL [Gracilibacillus salitolerans]QGH36208.1 large conductance mechanosensitive channel protein MscL [Gracilibacillus salitolerans]
MGLFKEFRQFMMRGSAIDIGIGVVLGAAVSSFVDSLVRDILLPPIGLVYSRMNIENLHISLSGRTYSSLADAKEAGAITINYGLFISTSIRFVIILFIVFLVVRQMNRWKKPHQHPLDSMTKKECPYCCLSIPNRAVICPNCSSSLEKKQSAESTTYPRLKIK